LSTGLESLGRWPGTHRAAGWSTAAGRRATAGDTTWSFPLTSVTKLLTSAAVLVAVQEEILALDEPAGPPGSTVRHLLSHASGLPFEGREPVAHAGQRRIYGNAAFELLGELVAARAELGFSQYVREAVLIPLGMVATEYEGSPAHGARSTLDDLLRFAGELLRPGRVLAPELLGEATTPQLPELDGVLPGFGPQRPNPWGLGFELKGTKTPHWTPPEVSPHTFGHFGRSGTFLWVDPSIGVACVGLADEPFGPWAVEAWPTLGSEVVRAVASGRSTHVPGGAA